MKFMNYTCFMKPSRISVVRVSVRSLRRNTAGARVFLPLPELQPVEGLFPNVGQRIPRITRGGQSDQVRPVYALAAYPVSLPRARRETELAGSAPAVSSAFGEGRIHYSGKFTPSPPVWPPRFAYPAPVVVVKAGELAEDVIAELLWSARAGQYEVFRSKIQNVCRTYARLLKPNPKVQPQVAPAGNHALDQIAAARQRGAQFARNEWENLDNLSLQDAAHFAGVSDRTVNVRRQNGQLYALVAPGKTRGYRYPKWQFDIKPDRLALAIGAFLATGQKNSWVLHNFLLRPCADLDGVRPCDYLADASRDAQRLGQVIERRFSLRDQGAA